MNGFHSYYTFFAVTDYDFFRDNNPIVCFSDAFDFQIPFVGNFGDNKACFVHVCDKHYFFAALSAFFQRNYVSERIDDYFVRFVRDFFRYQFSYLIFISADTVYGAEFFHKFSHDISSPMPFMKHTRSFDTAVTSEISNVSTEVCIYLSGIDSSAVGIPSADT